MTTIEDRFRAAAQAVAGTVAPDSAPPLQLPSRPGRRPGIPRPPRHSGRPRWVAPLAAAASVIAVIATSLVITSGAHHSQPPAQATAGHQRGQAAVPRYYVALTGGPGPAGTGKQHAVVRATATGKVLARITPPAPYATFGAVTAASDDRTFVLAAGKWTVTHQSGGTSVNELPTKFFLLRLSKAGQPASLTPLPIPAQPQGMAGIALSPDGSKLAVATNHRSGVHVVNPAIGVFTLATGSARTWSWHGRAWITNNDAINQHLLSWAADERTIAFEQWVRDDEQVRLLDTAAPGSDLKSSALVLDFRHQAYTDWHFVHGRIVDALAGYNALITPAGTRIVCGTATDTLHPATTDLHFTEFSASTGKVVRELDHAPVSRDDGSGQDVLWTSPSGSTLIVSAVRLGSSFRTDRSVTGILRGNRLTPLPGDWRDVSDVAW
jgi:hypothetical protein